MRGGANRYSYSWGSRLSLCTPLGRHFRALIIGSTKMEQIIFPRFIRRKYSAARHTRSLGRSLAGGHRGCYSRLPFWFCGLRGGFGSPVTTTGALTTKRSGQTHPLAPLPRDARDIWAKIPFRSSCRISTATFFTLRYCSFSFSLTTPGERCGSQMNPVQGTSESALERSCLR